MIYSWRILLTCFLLCSVASSETVILKNDFYRTGWDDSIPSTVWTSHTLRESDIKFPRRSERYREDIRLPSSPKTSDYTRSGYDRGHMVPAGDLNFSAEALKSTFTMSNITPQKPELNRCGWLRLEKAIRGWVPPNAELKVITGVLFIDKENIRKVNDKVPIPDAFYKVIYCRERNDAIGFIMPNRVTTSPLEDYRVDIATIESASGTKLFSEYERNDRNKTESYKWFRKPHLFSINIICYLAGIVFISHSKNKHRRR